VKAPRAATGFVTTDRQITLVNTIGALWLRSNQNGDAFRVYQTVPTFEGDVIDAIAEVNVPLVGRKPRAPRRLSALYLRRSRLSAPF
jgi:hypothetical protein